MSLSKTSSTISLWTEITTISNGISQSRVSYSYDDSDRLEKVTVDLSPEDNDIGDGYTFTTIYGYDAASGLVNSITNSDGTSQSFTYEEITGEWRIKSFTDGESNVTNLVSEEVLGERVLTLTDPLGYSTIYSHDNQGRLSKLEGPEVGGQRATTLYSYDSDDNLIQMLDAEGKQTDYEYADGRLTQQQDSAGQVIQ